MTDRVGPVLASRTSGSSAWRGEAYIDQIGLLKEVYSSVIVPMAVIEKNGGSVTGTTVPPKAAMPVCLDEIQLILKAAQFFLSICRKIHLQKHILFFPFVRYLWIEAHSGF